MLFGERTVPLYLQLHTSEERFAQHGLAPMTRTADPIGYFHAKPYLIEPNIIATVALGARPGLSDGIGEIAGAENRGVRRREIGQEEPARPVLAQRQLVVERPSCGPDERAESLLVALAVPHPQRRRVGRPVGHVEPGQLRAPDPADVQHDEDRRVAGADQTPADARNGLASALPAARDRASEAGASSASTASAIRTPKPVYYVASTREPLRAL